MNYKLSDLYQFLNACGREQKNELLLFRGQDCSDPLLPKIARKNPAVNTKATERQMLEELRRVGGGFLPQSDEDDLDLLARAQHYGMATRLLDWTSNPLAAVWFACRDCDERKNGFVFSFVPGDELVLTKSDANLPFDTGKTIIYRPRLNNARIVAQAGWFTLHRFSEKSSRFIPLDVNTGMKGKIDRWEILGSQKTEMLIDLDQMGINYQSMFPDLEGVCRHLNWVHNVETRKTRGSAGHPQAAGDSVNKA